MQDRETDSRRGFALRPVALLLGLGWLILRAPNLLSSPRFWAEESAYVMAAARSDLWESLCSVYWRAGYFAWPANVGATLGVGLLPLEWAPLATTLTALLVQIAPCAAMLFVRFDVDPTPLQRCIAAAALLTATTSGQSIAWLNTISSQMHAGILTAVLLVASARQSTSRGSIALVVLLLLTGLTGAYSIFLLPAFLAAALAERAIWRYRQTAALAAAFAIQLGIVLYKRFGLGQVNEKRGSTSSVFDSMLVGIRESVAMPMFGQRATIGADGFKNLLLVLALIVLVTATVVLVRSARRTPGAAGTDRLRWLGSVEMRCLWAAISTFVAISLTAFGGLVAGRYAVVPGALTLLVVLLAAQRTRSRPVRWMLSGVIGSCIAAGVWNPREPQLLSCDGTSSGWQAAVRAWPGESPAHLPICPDGWTIRVHPRRDRPRT